MMQVDQGIIDTYDSVLIMNIGLLSYAVCGVSHGHVDVTTPPKFTEGIDTDVV